MPTSRRRVDGVGADGTPSGRRHARIKARLDEQRKRMQQHEAEVDRIGREIRVVADPSSAGSRRPTTFQIHIPVQSPSEDRGTGGEIQLTDSLARQIGISPFHGFRFSGERFDCGSKIGFLQANIAFALQRDDLDQRLRGWLTERTK